MRGIFDDTIAAIATAPGRGAIAVVRLSGRAAAEMLSRVCPSLGDALPEPREQRLLSIHHPEDGRRIDRALVTYFPAPASYTGESTVEFSTHGGALTPQLLLDALHAVGARLAEPGEFTRRALFHGKLDLLQAEAIVDLIDGRSPALHRTAVHQMERGLSRRIEEIRRQILRLEGLVAYSIDFPDEDEPPVPSERILADASAVRDALHALIRTAPQGEMLRTGAMLVLAGRPNSGKSSLFNALLGLERAIVTDVPGTTRDALEADATLHGFPFRLVDTAGLRDTSDRVERLGIEVARRYLGSADLVLFCLPANRAPEPEELQFLAEIEPERRLLVRTMSDARDEGGAPNASALRGHFGGSEFAPPGGIRLSALTGEGLETLSQVVLERTFRSLGSGVGEAPVVTRQRHVRALRSAMEEVGRFAEGLAGGVPIELAATHLGAATVRLEELIGIVTPDDVLGEVFAAFCVGK